MRGRYHRHHCAALVSDSVLGVRVCVCVVCGERGGDVGEAVAGEILLPGCGESR